MITARAHDGGDRRPAAQEDPGEVHGQNALPGLQADALQAHVPAFGPAVHDAGVGVEDVEGAPALQSRGDHPLVVLGDGDIAGEGDPLSACRGQGLDGLAGRGSVDVRRHHPGALARTAAARPMPLPAPVMIATFPARRMTAYRSAGYVPPGGGGPDPPEPDP
jgi:hypothetical protein